MGQGGAGIKVPVQCCMECNTTESSAGMRAQHGGMSKSEKGLRYLQSGWMGNR